MRKAVVAKCPHCDMAIDFSVTVRKVQTAKKARVVIPYHTFSPFEKTIKLKPGETVELSND